jgi:hypothetical protein
MARASQNSTAGPRIPRGPVWLWIVPLALSAGGWIFMSAGRHKQTGPAPSHRSRIPTADAATGQDDHGAAHRRAAASPAFFSNALSAIESETDHNKQLDLLEELVDQTPIADIQPALNKLKNLGQQGLIGEYTQLLVRRWAGEDGAAAAAWTGKLPLDSTRQRALSGVAIEWANSNLEDAGAWATQLKDTTEHDAACLAVSNEAVRTDPAAALFLAVDLPATPRRDELLHRATMEWASKDGQAAVEWAKDIKDDQLRNEMLAAATIAWSDTNPAAAAGIAADEMTEDRTQSDAVVSILQRWAQVDPTQALNWLKQFPEGQLKQTAIQTLESLGVSMK